ncbi:hypothetical protein GGR54DRAFT_296799 [Hypoxylon sp. NC1633]|nr:hypothetical protein GGR54DRAFT_296799 [Hypoxylon sp. NC1633]
MPLLSLPCELLLQIIEHLRNSRDVSALQSASRTCKALREPVEIYLYSRAVFVRLSRLYSFAEAVRTEPKRKGYLRDLQLLFSTSFYRPSSLPAAPPDLASFPNLTSFVSESPECQPSSRKGTHWKVFMESYTQTFERASLLNESVDTPRPLQNLRSLTLHWTGTHQRFWDITPACPIFLIPQLRSLEISCAKIGQGDLDKWDSERLQRFRHQTGLRSLVFEECVVSVEALHAILSLPTELRRLTLCEKHHHSWEGSDSFAISDSDTLNAAIAQQASSLEHLRIFRHRRNGETSSKISLSLSTFAVLSHLQLGPFIPGWGGETDQLDYALESPIPPVLQSLRLDEYGVFMIKRRRTDTALSNLLLHELLTNAEARGVNFTLDISFQQLHRLLLMHPVNWQRIRPMLRKLVGVLVKKLEEQFEQHQDVSVLSHPGRQPSSRLRILTNKYHHKIPPYLHGERLPRYVVRYDSHHPERFLPEPYAYHLASSDGDMNSDDGDMSSDDEDMDVAFRDVGYVDLNLLVQLT